jgi:hypothetical protein
MQLYRLGAIINILFAEEIEVLLHSQPLTNSHFHFLVIVEMATCQVIHQRYKQINFREV